MRFLKLLALFTITVSASAQSAKDSLLSTERSIDRPITLHGGQFRFTGGYDLGITTRRFDDAGSPIHLKDEGISYATHSFLIDMRYGLHEYVQLGLRTYHRNQTQRKEQVLTFSSDIFEVFEISKRTGLEDLLITLHFRAPFKTRKFDLIAGAGYLLPLSDGKASRPEHVMIEDRLGNSTYYNFIYNYRNHWATGVNAIFAEGAFKLRGNKSAISAQVTYQHSLNEGQNLRWSHQLINDEFQYRSSTYSFVLQDVLSWQLEYEYQFAPWFDFSMIAAGRNGTGGWEEINDQRVSRPESSLVTISPGYEILVTSKIWLRQRLHISAAGKSAEAPFLVSTALVYNFFPFN